MALRRVAARSKKVVRQPQVRREDAIRSKAARSALRRDKKRAVAAAIKAARQCKLSARAPPQASPQPAFPELDRIPSSEFFSKKVSAAKSNETVTGGIKAFRLFDSPPHSMMVTSGNKIGEFDDSCDFPSDCEVSDDYGTKIAGIPTSKNIFDALSSVDEETLEDVPVASNAIQQFHEVEENADGHDEGNTVSPLPQNDCGGSRDPWWIRSIRFIGRVIANVAAVVVTVAKVVDQSMFNIF